MDTKENSLKPHNQENHLVNVRKSEVFCGPVPHPEILERYEKVYPGAAKMIFEEWDGQVHHRQSLEKSVIRTDNVKSILGVVFGFLIDLAAIVGGIYSATEGLITFGIVLVLAGVTLLITTFLVNRRGNGKAEENENRKAAPLA